MRYIVCLIVMSKAFLKQRTNNCDTLNPFFQNFFASAMFIRLIYECSQLHRYIVCLVGVIVFNKHWEQGIQIELACNSKFFPCSPYQCQHHLNYIHILCPELSCFTVTVFQNFRFECMVSTFYVSKQRN